MDSERKCKICGKICGKGSHEYVLGMCLKHYTQFKRYGKCLDNSPRTLNDDNEIRIMGNYAEVDTYDKLFDVNYTYKISIEDIKLLEGRKWKTYKGQTNKEPYLVCLKKNERMIFFHQLVIDNLKGRVKYLNGDTTDIRRENLIDISNDNVSEFTNNKNKTGIRGTYYGSDKFCACLCINKKTFVISGLDTLEEAVYLRDKMEKDYGIKIKRNEKLINECLNKLQNEDKKGLNKLYEEKKDIFINGVKTNYELVKEHKEEIEKYYYIDKIGVRKISKIYGVSYSMMMEYMIKMGFEIRKPNDNKEFVKDDNELIELFMKRLSINEISKIINVGQKAVARRIKELNLIRPKLIMPRDQYDGSNDEIMISLYNEGKSTTDIGKILNISHGTVLNHLNYCGIERRTLSESQFNYNKKEFPKELKDYNTVYDMYIIQRLSKKDMSETFNVSTHVIDRVLREFNIHIRNSSEAKIGLYTGSKHPNWKNGRSGLYMRLREYFRWSQIKPVIKRDGGKCQICGSSKHLQVHHIHHFKDIFDEILAEHPELDIKLNEEELYEIMRNDERLNSLDNLITYCKECHLFKVHGYKHRK